MSTTRRAPKRKRIKRRAENEQLRTARRDSLSILLSRAQRGVLSRDDAALLRTHVETELAEADAARQSERGQQRAMEQQRRRVEAAEQAIRELEQRVANQADSFEVQARLIREAEQRAEQAEEQLRAHRAVEESRQARARRLEADMRDTEAISARQTSYLNAVRDALGAPNWEVLADMAAKLRAERDRLARTVTDMHDGINATAREAFAQRRAHREELRAAEQRAATYRSAWRSARARARKHAAEERRVRGWLEHWADRSRAAEHRAGRYRLAWLAARRDRRADRAAMAAERPAVEAVEHVRAQCEDWAKQSPAVTHESRVRDQAVATAARIILDLLPPAPAKPVDAQEPPKLRRMTVDLSTGHTEPAEPDRPVYLGTPCAYCGHARNHHPCGGPCCAGAVDAGCDCPVFTVTAPARP